MRVSVCVCVWICVCMWERVFVCECMSVYVCMCASEGVWVCVLFVLAFVCGCVCVWECVCACVCANECCVCVWVCCVIAKIRIHSIQITQNRRRNGAWVTATFFFVLWIALKYIWSFLWSKCHQNKRTTPTQIIQQATNRSSEKWGCDDEQECCTLAWKIRD